MLLTRELMLIKLESQDVTMAARRLAMNVIESCAVKLEAGIKQFLISSISGDNRSVNSHIEHHEVIYDIYRCAPQILSGVVPYLTGELLVITDSAAYGSVHPLFFTGLFNVIPMHFGCIL